MDTLTIELPPQPTQRESNLRRWVEVMHNPDLCRIEGRIETDRHGHHDGALARMLICGEDTQPVEVCRQVSETQPSLQPHINAAAFGTRGSGRLRDSLRFDLPGLEKVCSHVSGALTR